MFEKGSSYRKVYSDELEKANKKNRKSRLIRFLCILFVSFFFLGWGWWFIGRWPIVIKKGGSGAGEAMIAPLIHFTE